MQRLTPENEIDKLVYELYNLREDEIAIVKGNVCISDDADDADKRGF